MSATRTCSFDRTGDCLSARLVLFNRFLTDLFDIPQGVMGLIIVCGLVIKRMREKPRRKWKIWLADVGKQVVGQFAVHLSNVAISGESR